MTRILTILLFGAFGFGAGKWEKAQTKREMNPMNIAGAIRIAQPPIAPLAWSELDRCAPATAKIPLDSVRWVQADSIPAKYGRMNPAEIPLGESIHGAWIPEHRTIVLLTGALRISAEYRHFLIRHELMHARLAPTMGHPQKYFNVECGTELYPKN